MATRSVIVELNALPNMFPLVAGYLEGYARKFEAIERNYHLDHYVADTSLDHNEICDALLEKDAQIYAFSCYVWNIGLVKTVLRVLKQKLPNALFVLGGPQVINDAAKYAGPEDRNVIVCNGEGEKTYSNILLALLEEAPDFATVNGISFHRDGEVVTTAPEPRIMELDTIPSPFELESMQGIYDTTIFETNRGCPFRCSFCFWGAANNDRVYKFSEDRIYSDLDRIGRNRIPILFIADANWGMLKRDIEFSRFIVESNSKYRVPISVVFSASKNSPDRVAEIMKIYSDNNMLTSYPISLQSLNDHTLEMVDRKNIKFSAYRSLQDNLNEAGIGSYIELIWPLPGETLESVKLGMAELCRQKAGLMLVFAHMLLPNTPMLENRDKHGLITRIIEDSVGDYEIVTGTSDVTPAEFKAGVWFVFGINALHNSQTAILVMRYLDAKGEQSFNAFIDSFMAYAKTQSDHPFTEFCNYSIEDLHNYDFVKFPTIYAVVLHQSRHEFTQLLLDFSRTQTWWNDEKARFLLELDILRRPFVYKNTPEDFSATEFEFFTVSQLDGTGRNFELRLDTRFLELFCQSTTIDLPEIVAEGQAVISMNHDKMPLNYLPNLSEKDKADRINSLMFRANTIEPTYEIIEIIPYPKSFLRKIAQRFSASA